MGRGRATGMLVALALLAGGCGSKQSALDPHAKPAREIASFWWWLLGGLAFGLVVVCALIVASWVRRHHTGVPGFRDADRAGWAVVLSLGFAVPIVGLAVLFLFSDIFLIRDTQAPAAASTRLTVKVVAHQFWWEIRYPGSNAVTANELHIPVRTPVDLEVTTRDVIHTFWVPQLNRKIDTIPGQTNRILLYADRTGRYRGQCAEFCGLQHAHMSLYVFADPPARFRAWLAHEARPARAGSRSAGFGVFASAGCDSCHRIRGTEASGYVGPDLTHLGSRTSLGALVIPNDRWRLREWIRDSQRLKPGNRMPAFRLAQRDLGALVAYLEGLK